MKRSSSDTNHSFHTAVSHSGLLSALGEGLWPAFLSRGQGRDAHSGSLSLSVSQTMPYTCLKTLESSSRVSLELGEWGGDGVNTHNKPTPGPAGGTPHKPRSPRI